MEYHVILVTEFTILPFLLPEATCALDWPLPINLTLHAGGKRFPNADTVLIRDNQPASIGVDFLGPKTGAVEYVHIVQTLETVVRYTLCCIPKSGYRVCRT